MYFRELVTVSAPGALACVLAVAPVPAYANEAQYHVCGVGLNLGQAASREYFFGQAFGGEPPPDQVGYIGKNVADAVGHAEAAESLFPGVQSGNLSATQVIGNLSAYMGTRAGMSPGHRANYLGSLAGNYKDRVSYTFVSHRNPPFVSKPVCDTKLFDACYHFGYASTAAAVGDETAKLSSIGAMRTAINEGLELAGDRRPISSVEYVCCSMGSPAAWSKLLGYTSQTPHAAFVDDTPTIMSIAREARLAPGACGTHSGSGDIVGHWRGCNGRTVRFVRRGSEYVGYYTALGDLGRFGFRPNEESHRVRRIGPGRYTGLVKWRWTNGRMEWRETTITVDGHELTDSAGDPCGRTMTRQ